MEKRKRMYGKSTPKRRKDGGGPDVPMEAIYAAFGRALFSFHSLERQLISFVATWDALKNQHSDEQLVGTLDGLGKRTFGQVIDAGLKNGAISEELSQSLRPATVLRNALVHRLYESIPLRLATRQGPQQVFEELWSIGDSYRGLAQEVGEMAMHCCELRGISSERIDRLARRAWDRASRMDSLSLPSNK